MGRNSDHDKGQSDGTQNKYEPPVPIGVIDEVIQPTETLEKWRERNDDYDKGWNNGYKQR